METPKAYLESADGTSPCNLEVKLDKDGSILIFVPGPLGEEGEAWIRVVLPK